ncbi:DUF4158 domain-containing protein [Mycobacterium intracellulare]|uniref:DUF4158 domain-containing protein n=1 Tax=Mycobacterium intracellulare TaxID=1767 RepID=UPI0006CA9A0F|nr:DUF4158 domain-containing protein [Mycobacterium intracellulare]KPN46763.1 hypothetical protein AN933_25665 [Mycobacterium intracellulare subsp. chimaera]MCA2312452.1 DUF4158 domain-containing protein [Mycobacterium intracellulare subsp. chimaera]MCA2354787.1 DUF4158 domain-containing protein [Mycobacterium intracellulare subsp. chimaera]MEE3755389.1 DUF4158 domain-containing protein [Mycobacterium intracellulare]
MAREVDQDGLIDCWTLVGDELELVAGKRGATKLGFALLLRYYTERGRFPRGRSEIPDAAVDYMARQVEVDPTEIAFYEWTGRTSKFHRAQIRQALGVRECTVLTAEVERGLTPLFWSHVLPYGEVKLDMNTRLALSGPPSA